MAMRGSAAISADGGWTHLRVVHGWTLAEYREAFQLLQSVPTCARDVSAGLRGRAYGRQGRKGFGTPPSDAHGNTRPVPGWRSLRRVRPDLAAELHESRNGELDPGVVAAGSHRKAWWRCQDCGHEWEATVDNRVGRGAGCPRCARRGQVEDRSTVERGRSLAVNHPDLAAELHPDRNIGLDPYALARHSARVVWWRCGSCGQDWEAVVANRAAGTGCPACWQARRSAAQSVVAPERSLVRRAPELVAEFHPTLNPGLDPTTLGAGSGLKAWWQCRNYGHEWAATVTNRTSGSGCPRCARKSKHVSANQVVPH
jgi:Zn finger protein HypA/HybF involved in hydrogenase expression